jgi:hypothetical protein
MTTVDTCNVPMGQIGGRNCISHAVSNKRGGSTTNPKPKTTSGSGEGSKTELLRDGNVGEDAISKLAKSTWWNWDKGSALLLWHWPKGEQRLAARDGMQTYIDDSLPNYQVRAWPLKKEVYKLLLPKVRKRIARGYVKVGQGQNFIKS